MAKLFASQVLVVILQYAMLLLICFFLYRVIKIVYIDFHSFRQPALPIAKTAKLIVLTSGMIASNRKEFLINDTVNIGRNETNDVVINEATVSYEHACIYNYRNHFVLSDLNSTNGVLHNGMRLQQDIELHRGDKIQIGSTIFQFEE